MKRLSLLLAPCLLAVLASVATPATTLAQATQAPGCIRRHVPNPWTLHQMTSGYASSTINTIPADDFQGLQTGPDIPDSSQHPGGFYMAMWGIYSPDAAQCTDAASGLSQGALIQVSGGTEIDVLASAAPPPAPSCIRRPVPNRPTLNAIASQYYATLASITANDFLKMSVGQPIPDASQSSFQADVGTIYDQGSAGTVCAQPELMVGQAITAGGEFDIVSPPWSPGSAYCLRRATPPSPPAGGAVLAAALDPNSAEPNIVVLPQFSQWKSGMCGASVMRQPATIALPTVPDFTNRYDVALAFADQQHGLTSAWGAVNVDAGSPAPVLYPGRPDFTTTSAQVYSGLYRSNGSGVDDFFRAYSSCRHCMLDGYGKQAAQHPNDGIVSSQPRPNQAYAFDLSYAFFPDAQLRGPVANGQQQGFSFSDWNLSDAYMEGVAGLPQDMSGANLSGAHLSKNPLAGVNLQGANLSGADLAGCNLTKANLYRANLAGAYLEQADLTEATLYYSDLSGAQFYHTIVTGAGLADTNLSGVDFTQNMTGLNTVNLSYTNLSGANLKGIDLSNLYLIGATLRQATLTNTNMTGAKLEGADLSDTDLTSTSLSWADLQGANLSGANLNQSYLMGTDLTAANLSGANLSGANLEWSNQARGGGALSRANLSGANLHGTNLQYAILDGSDLSSTDLTSTQLGGANISNANLSNANLTGVDLQGYDLHGDNFQAATLTNTNMTGAILSGANFQRATLTNTNMAGADLTAADLGGTNLTLTPLTGANLSAANLSGANMNLTPLGNANLSGANLNGANLSGTTLIGAKLQALNPSSTTPTPLRVNGTSFDRTDLRGVQLSGLAFDTPPVFSDITVGKDDSGNCTSLIDVDLRAVGLTLDTVLPGCENSPLLPGSTVPLDLVSGWLQQELYISVSNARFAVDASNRSSLANLNLGAVDLSGAVFVGWPVDLSSTNLNGANLTKTQLPGAVLSGASLQNVKAPGATFSGASLAGIAPAQAASFAGANTDLTNADFAGADLSGASFVAANISGASFEGALATAPDFNSVVGKNASFAGAHIQDNTGKAFNTADDLSGAKFTGAVLVGDRSLGGGLNFTGTNLQGADFQYAQCIGCNFAKSKLDNADFSYAYVMGAVFSNATMAGTNMTNAWLHCGDSSNSQCTQTQTPPQTPMWSWPLVLGEGELSGDISFTATDWIGVSGALPKYCPDSQTDWQPDPDQIDNSTSPPTVKGVCNGHLQPKTLWNFPACSAAGFDACPTATSQLFDASQMPGKLLSMTSMTPPVWPTTLPDSNGFAVGLDDGTVRHVPGDGRILAGSSKRKCPDSTQACGDGGPASQALLGTPAGLAVGLDGSLYIADSTLHRVRRIDPSGTIITVAGSGQHCTANGASACGNGASATAAQLTGPYGVWIDPLGVLVIADGSAGLRQVGIDGTLSLLAGSNAYDVRSVVGDAAGNVFAATHNPDYLIQVDTKRNVSVVVGTGTSGYNGNVDPDYGILLDGDQVQISDPNGLSVDGNGNILFADTGNNMIRAYVPPPPGDSDGHLMDPLGGCVVYANSDDSIGTPQGGNNGWGQWSDEIELSGPVAVTWGAGGLLVVADSGNQRLLELGVSPLPSPSSTTGPACETASNSTATSVRASHKPTLMHASVTPQTPVATPTPVTPVATLTRVATHTPVATLTPVATHTPAATATPVATHTPVGASTAAASRTPVAISTPTTSAAKP